MEEFKPDEWPRIVQLPNFSRSLDGLELSHTEVIALERAVQKNPLAGKPVRRTGGLRKLRFARPGQNRGKSGSFRVGYFHFPVNGVIVFIVLWAKGEKDDLTKAEENGIAKLARDIKDLLREGHF